MVIKHLSLDLQKWNMKRYLLLCLFAVFSLALCAQEQRAPRLALNEGITYTKTENSGVTIETKIAIEKEGEQAKIVFWQETNNGFLFKKTNWIGRVMLELDNGEMITLIDRNLKGHSMHPGGYIAGYFIPDIYQRHATYHLTDSECAKLKQRKLVSVAYQLDDEFEPTTKYLYVKDDQFALREQLEAIGK